MLFKPMGLIGVRVGRAYRVVVSEFTSKSLGQAR